LEKAQENASRHKKSEKKKSKGEGNVPQAKAKRQASVIEEDHKKNMLCGSEEKIQCKRRFRNPRGRAGVGKANPHHAGPSFGPKHTGSIITEDVAKVQVEGEGGGSIPDPGYY